MMLDDAARRRTAVAALGLALASCLAGLVAFRLVRDRDGDGDPGTPATPGQDGATPAPGDPPAVDEDTDPDVLNDTGHGHTAATGPVAVVWWQQLSTLDLATVTSLIADGVGSDLDAATRIEAGETASSYVTADLTGVGRDRFPRSWDGDDTAAPATACCRDVEILAVGASSYPDEPPLVLALVVWTATPVNGIAQFDAWEASFVFLAPAAGGGYEVVDPSAVTSWRTPPGLGLPSP